MLYEAPLLLLLCTLALICHTTTAASNRYKVWDKNEFKLKLEATKTDCFYRSVANASTFHVSFHVVKGADINFFLFDGKGKQIENKLNEQQGSYQVDSVDEPGDFKICFDNSYSHFEDKVILVYVISFHMENLKTKFEDEKYFNESAVFISKVVSKIHLNMIDVVTQQALGRFHQSKDEYLLEANNEMVMMWSFSQTVIILVCGVFQVFFIKKFFSLNYETKVRRDY